MGVTRRTLPGLGSAPCQLSDFSSLNPFTTCKMKASYYTISDSFPPRLPATHFASLHLTSTCFYPVSVSSKSASKDTRCHILGKEPYLFLGTLLPAPRLLLPPPPIAFALVLSVSPFHFYFMPSDYPYAQISTSLKTKQASFLDHNTLPFS